MADVRVENAAFAPPNAAFRTAKARRFAPPKRGVSRR
jgi:hypothetical protein